MERTAPTSQFKARPRLRPIALPTEHGGWSMILEPIILGWWVAFSGVGLLLGFAAFATFLSRHPFQLVIRDRKRGKRYPRTQWAERFVIAYVVFAAAAMLLAIVATDYPFWQPFTIAVPLAIIQIWYDVQNRSRDIVAEVAGAIAVGVVAAMIVLADGWQTDAAFALWGILIARIVGTILYVRARLRLERGEKPDILLAHFTHILGLISVIILFLADLVPGLAIIALSLLIARSLYGLSKYRRPAPRAAIIGIQEVVFGIITIALIGVGYTAGL
jgi:hypothetical protein